MLAADTVQKILRRIDQLPTLPTVIDQIMDLTDRDDTSAAQLLAVIAADQSLTANLLKVANSPVYGVPYRIETAKQAVLLLGFEEIRHLAMSALIFTHLTIKVGGAAFSRERFWRHSFLVADLARAWYAVFPNRALKPAYFTAGLLHDIGKVVLDYYFPEDFANILDVMRQEQEPPLRAEERFLGVTHAFVGAALLQRWQLPKYIVEAVREHHSPWEVRAEPQLAAALYYANLLAGLLGQPAYPDEITPSVDQFYDSRDARRLADADLLVERERLEHLLAAQRGAAAPTVDEPAVSS
jgi:putative nucleotidyltransferase with HDIG domain